MHWARALMLAETLLKVVQANVAREARGAVKHHANQESLMDTETLTPASAPNPPMEVTAATPEAAAPQPPATTQVATAVSTIDGRLQNVASLVQTLSSHPDVMSLLCVLLEVPVQNQTTRD